VKPRAIAVMAFPEAVSHWILDIDMFPPGVH
jgi:hypothetical protein